MTYQGRDSAEGGVSTNRIAQESFVVGSDTGQALQFQLQATEVSMSPVRLRTKRRVTTRSAQQQDMYSRPTNWSSVFSSSIEYTQRP